MAKLTEPYWQPLTLTTPLSEDIKLEQPVPEPQPRWHTVVACAAGFPLGYAAGFGIACLGLYELPWQWVAVGAILPGLVIGFLIAALIEDELRWR